MTVKNKERYTIYLDKEKTEYVVSFLETTRNKGGLSGLFNTYLGTVYKTLKLSGYKPGQKKVTVAQMFRIGLKGLRQPV